MPELNVAEMRATVARLEERISIEQRKKRDRDAVHFDRASDADDRDAYHHDWAAFRKQAAEDAYRELPALLAAVKALLEDRERLAKAEDVNGHLGRLCSERHEKILSLERELANERSHSAWTEVREQCAIDAARANVDHQRSPTRSDGESSRSSEPPR